MFKILDGACTPKRGTKYSAYVDLFAREDVYIFDEGVSVKGSKVKICFTAQDIIDISLKFYKQALDKGV